MINLNSIWTDTAKTPEFPSLQGDIKTDVLIIGGGIAGLLCAYMLKQAGVDYILLEADRICRGVTGNTTAKITSQHGLIYSKLIKEFGVERALLYLKANEEAIGEYRRLCKNIKCDFTEKFSCVFSKESILPLEKEMDALIKLNFKNARFSKNINLPVNTIGGISFSNQAEFNPLKFLSTLASGLNIYENTKVKSWNDREFVTEHGRVTADKAIVTTHFPIFNKHGGYFLKMYQQRSYVLGLENAEIPNGMFIDENEDGLSFRNYKNVLLLGGGTHRTGKSGGGFSELQREAFRYYPDAEIKYKWATQDCMTLDGVPYIGRYCNSKNRLYVATGFNKWGMTSAMSAALLLRDMILDKENPYQQLYDPSRTILRPQLFVNALETASNLLKFKKPRCPHMGCALWWNREEHSWDCPCHGSRFTETGELIENPATDDLNCKKITEQS